MSQGVSVESSTQPLRAPSINPVLQAALSSLDVQLEEELSRYRRQRSGRPVPPARRLGRHQSRKPIELISVGTASSPIQSPTFRQSEAPPVSYSQSAVENPMPSAEKKADADRQLTDRTSWLSGPSSNNTGEPLSYQITLAKNAASEADNPATINPDSHSGNPQAGRSVGVGLGNPYANNSQPDDYLASSEQLLRSLAEEEANDQAERRFLDRVLTPLGVGLMLLLLLSSATVGYIVMNPSIWAGLGLDRFGKPQTPNVAQNPTAGIPLSGNQPQRQLTINGSNPGSPIINGPNLATQEFVELNLNTLSSLKTNPTQGPVLLPNQRALPPLATAANPQKVPSTSAALGGRPSDLASALLPPSLSSTVMSGRVPSVAPIPAPPATTRTPATPAAKQKQTSASRYGDQVATSAAQPGKDNYYVLTNYENDRSLQQMRKVVADAYVRNFPEGARIQVATFNKESQAKKMVQQLQKQGISAWVYHPHP